MSRGLRAGGTRVLAVLGALAIVLAVDRGHGAAFAQNGSSRPVRLIVPFDPGAAVDVVARILARGLAAQWDRPVIVENRAGGSTLLAAQLVARSDPDGDTLLFGLDDTFTIVPHLTKALPFDPNKKRVPVNLVGKLLMIMVANKDLPADTLPALIDLARASPGALNYGSSGPGSATHLGFEMLKASARIDIQHVPFRGLAPALTATASGVVQMTMIGYGTARGMIEEGTRIKPLVVASPERVAALPNLPTIGELGYPEVDSTSWLAVAAPAKASAATIARINDAIARELGGPTETRKQIEARDVVVTNIGPTPFAAEIARRYRVNEEAVRISGAQRDQ